MQRITILALTMALPLQAVAQTDVLYLSDGDGDRILAVQGAAIINTFPAVPPIRAFPIAVVAEVRTTGYALGEIGAEYTLAGVPTGVTYTLNEGGVMSDGSTDTLTYNWGISFTGNVWRYDRDWANGVLQFAAGDFAGIAYDLSDDTLWISRDRNAGITHVDQTGMVLGSFSTVGNLDWIMALEPSTDTLWVSERFSQTLTNYDKMGSLLGQHVVPGMTPSSFFSGEFHTPGGGIAILQVDAVDTVVVAGRGGYPVTMDLENIGVNQVTIDTVGLIFTGTADRTPEYTVTPDPGNPAVIAGQATTTLAFSVDVMLGATLEPITLDGSVQVTDTVTAAVFTDSDADITDLWDTLGCLAPSCGDCNGDLVVTILDALTAAQHAAGLLTLAGEDLSNCNVTGLLEPDPMAEVTVLDALTIAQAAAGLPVTLACC